MPKGRYTIGGKGTHGCKGYPVVGDTGKVHGCHTTRESAQRQQAAIYAAENTRKSIDEWSFLLNKNCECNECFEKAKSNNMDEVSGESRGKRKKEKHGPMHKSISIVTDHPDCQGFGLVNEMGELISCHKTKADAENAAMQHESQDNGSEDNGSDMSNVNKSMNTDPGILGEEREAVLDPAESPISWGGVFKPVLTKASKPNYGNIIRPRKGEPSNKELYARIVAEAKRKFDVYPSAVANAWVVQEYKRRGGTYKSSN